MIGSTLVARRAGTKFAIMPAMTRNRATRWTSRLPISRVDGQGRDDTEAKAKKGHLQPAAKDARVVDSWTNGPEANTQRE